jgi:hypothetical protein
LSDLNVKDKQNFSSCQKISYDKVLNLLLQNDKYKGTYNYLLILNLLIIAYTERSISITDRIYYAWIVLFYVLLWWTWLHIEKPKRKPKVLTKKKNQKRDQLLLMRVMMMMKVQQLVLKIYNRQLIQVSIMRFISSEKFFSFEIRYNTHYLRYLPYNFCLVIFLCKTGFK